MDKIGIGTAGITALLGYAVVFFGLVLLLVVVTLLGKAMVASRKKAAPAIGQPAAPAPLPQELKPALPEAKGTGGQVMLHNVPEREAAVVMAVVAYRLNKPLNQLRFISIREVKDDEI